uniref:Nucleotide-diphospho-sugar transferase domain-containing protein n=1 Tax=viral metagenome TaxID=1070528 RepID=A0A6C0EGY4_9ZZZZ
MNNTCIVYLASRLDDYNSILSTGESRFDMTCLSLKNVTTHLKLPVIMFHEDFTEKETTIMKNIYEDITFEKIDFIRPDLPFNQKSCITSGISDGTCTCINENIKNPRDVCFRPKGYLMMCRFFSGQMQKHTSLEKYDRYIRFDDDSFLIEPFKIQEEFLTNFNSFDYGYRSVFIERQDQKSLWEFTKKFCIKLCLKQKKSFSRFINYLTQQRFISNGNYTGLCPYNNFHCCKLSLWKNPAIKEYIDEIESKHGCLLLGWMDANIHAMIIFVLAPLLELNIGSITDFGYRHNRHFSFLNNQHIQYRENEDFFPKN